MLTYFNWNPETNFTEIWIKIVVLFEENAFENVDSKILAVRSRVTKYVREQFEGLA